MPTRHAKFFKCPLRLIRLILVIVPRRLRADWKQEWEAELRNREVLLANWDRLYLRTKLICSREVSVPSGMRSGCNRIDGMMR